MRIRKTHAEGEISSLKGELETEALKDAPKKYNDMQINIKVGYLENHCIYWYTNYDTLFFILGLIVWVRKDKMIYSFDEADVKN